MHRRDRLKTHPEKSLFLIEAEAQLQPHLPDQKNEWRLMDVMVALLILILVSLSG